ncbi:MAG TPA: tRNA (5-methylaminomethyl-2-thiouridylate)-methyltransferase, partial [Sphingobacteriaceae bacterium]|nr:tRNA (5-methylaminomethyl-2-thiouridylate)-methyltransferase [Sphingobacteriaceae bacterium]
MLELVKTADGSNTLFNSEVGENYHSRNGALQESKHVFLNSGLQHYLSAHETEHISVLEVGFGTGLNFLITTDFCTEKHLNLDYTGIEAYPLNTGLIEQTGYGEYVSPEIWKTFLKYYPETLIKKTSVNEYCKLLVAHCKLMDFKTDLQFDVLYFDAFASIHQPEMWTDESLSHVCQFLKPGGVFVTYAI